jgi:ABC-type glycerol-3-phosphate transport system permease component
MIHFSQHFVSWPRYMAASVVVLTPVAMLVFLGQKTLSEWTAYTGLCG